MRNVLATVDALFDSDPTAAIRRARLAVYLAGFLADSREKSLLLGLAHKELANTLWNVNKYADAQQAVEVAEMHYRRVAGTEEDLATLNVIRSIILRGLNTRLDEAEELLRCAASVFLQHGSIEKYVNARLAEGMILFTRGRYQQAQTIFQSIIEKARDNPRSLAQLHNNIGHCWVMLGHRERAAESFFCALTLYEEFQMTAEIPRAKWGLAQLEFEAGHMAEALTFYRQAQAGFQKAGRTIDVGLVAFEIVGVLARIGDYSCAVQEAAALVELFAKAQMPVRAIQAANYVRDITALHEATTEKLKYVGQYLSKISLQPDLAFEPPRG